MVPLGSLVDVRRVLGSELITHYNLYPAAPLVGSPAPGYSSGEALDIMEPVASANLPQNMGYN
jgi:hydrophobic/amphiphilic exporter-1 (mainly G- bacteria), HAE1 family